MKTQTHADRVTKKAVVN